MTQISPSGHRVLQQIKEGRAAYYAGVEAEKPPYTDPQSCAQWRAGWIEAQQEHRRTMERDGQTFVERRRAG